MIDKTLIFLAIMTQYFGVLTGIAIASNAPSWKCFGFAIVGALLAWTITIVSNAKVIKAYDIICLRKKQVEEKKKKKMLSVFTKAFPLYCVRFEGLNEGPESIGVGGFNVPKEKVTLVRNKIFDLSEDFDDYCIIPMVRNVETTKEYYPELIKDLK